MKKEFRAAIKEGIMNSDMRGYKWTVTPTGLRWSYGEDFTFAIECYEDGVTILLVKALQSKVTVASLAVGADRWCDCSDLTEAYRMATEAAICTANHIY